MVKLYTIHCPACKVLAKKLDAKEIEYQVIDNPDELEALNITQFPILEVDGKRYSFSEAVKYVNAQ